MNDGNHFVRAQRHFRHEIARLDVLWVGDPGGEVTRVPRQGTGGDRLPTGNVRQVGAELSAGERAADRVAKPTALSAKQLLATNAERIVWARRALVLVIAPASVFVARQCSDCKIHMRVLRATELSALPAVNAGCVRNKLNGILLTGDHVHL